MDSHGEFCIISPHRWPPLNLCCLSPSLPPPPTALAPASDGPSAPALNARRTPVALRAEFEISCVRRHALAVEMGRVDHRVQRRVQWMLRKNHETSEAARQGAYLPFRLRK